MCHHPKTCPDATSEARDLAAVVSSHPEQGWSLLCNGVVVFDDLDSEAKLRVYDKGADPVSGGFGEFQFRLRRGDLRSHRPEQH